MTYFAIVDDKIPVTTVFDGFLYDLQVRESYRACYCCADACSTEVAIVVQWCGMSVSFSLAIPGSSGFVEDPAPPPDSYLVVDAQIYCTTCGWVLSISVCAYCDATNQFASDAFTAVIPFASTQAPSGGYCPASGQVELECFGEQFGIPCVTTTTAEIP